MKKIVEKTNPCFDEMLEKIERVCKETITPYASDVDQHSRFPQESIDALKSLKLMSSYVPTRFGGMGFDIEKICTICEILGRSCASTALIFAMHQIQVASIIHHCLKFDYFVGYVKLLVSEQRLIASVTSEVGVGGDLLASLCAVEKSEKKFYLVKKAPVISYGDYADDFLLSARKSPEAAKSDQVLLLFNKDQCQLEPMSKWDALGFRGTCSAGFVISGVACVDQIVPVSFADIFNQTMHPYSHIAWSSVWLGIATSSISKARSVVGGQAIENADSLPVYSLDLVELVNLLDSMRGSISNTTLQYYQMLEEGDSASFRDFGFKIKINNLKISSSRLLIDIVGKSMQICGISSYRNDSGVSLCRHIRDAYGASLMVSNNRIKSYNAAMLTYNNEEGGLALPEGS